MNEPVTRSAPSSFSERQWLGAGSWVVLLVLVGTVIAAFIPVGPTATTIAAVVAALGAAWAVQTLSTRVRVDGGELRAGRAHIAAELLGDVEVLDRAQTRRALGPEHDPRAFLCQRGWISTAVRTTVLDPGDATPYWLVSTRRPADLAAALLAAGAQARADDPGGAPTA